MNKTLHTIQVITKIGLVIARVVWIVATVSIGLSVAAMIAVACGWTDLVAQLGAIKIYGLVKTDGAVTTNQAYLLLVAVVLLLTGVAVMAWFTARYFARQVRVATPFTMTNAQGLQKLGLIWLIGSVLTSAVVSGVVWGMSVAWHTTINFNDSVDGGVILGVMFLVLSLFCRYGAEKVGNTAIIPPDDQAQPNQ